MILHDNPESSNALKVRFLLGELGLGYERVTIPFASPRPAAFLERQPAGTIPLLEDGDVRVGESNAILRYLAARERRDDLYPAALAERARVDWALDLWSTQVRPPLRRLEEVALWGVVGADEETVASRVAGAARALDVYERFCGDDGIALRRFTIADCCVAPVLWRASGLPLELERWPRLRRVLDAITARPAWQAAGPVT